MVRLALYAAAWASILTGCYAVVSAYGSAVRDDDGNVSGGLAVPAAAFAASLVVAGGCLVLARRIRH